MIAISPPWVGDIPSFEAWPTQEGEYSMNLYPFGIFKKMIYSPRFKTKPGLLMIACRIPST
jgi:hypothetical protein